MLQFCLYNLFMKHDENIEWKIYMVPWCDTQEKLVESTVDQPKSITDSLVNN